jgi:hypothetical protein
MTCGGTEIQRASVPVMIGVTPMPALPPRSGLRAERRLGELLRSPREAMLPLPKNGASVVRKKVATPIDPKRFVGCLP